MTRTQPVATAHIPHVVAKPAVIKAATELYLAGSPIDMTTLSKALGVSRATLYRRVGRHDDLLGAVLAEQTELTFHSVPTPVDRGPVDTVCEVLGVFAAVVVRAEPLQTLIRRDPSRFIRVVMGPGLVEDRGVDLVQQLIEAQVGGTLHTPPRLLARTIVRMSDATIYAQLLQNMPPDTDELFGLIRLLIEAATH